MRRHSARLLSQLGILTLSMSLLGCGPSLPPAQSPEQPEAPRHEARPVRESGEATIPRAFASGNTSSPLDLRADAPPPEAQPEGNTLTQPGSPPVSLDDLQSGLPSKIPQGMAGALLRPLDQGGVADVRAPGLAPGAGDGLGYGALPDLLDYGVYPRLLYYNFRSCWVPYILVDDCYYPYVYQPYFQPLFAGHCYYPLFVYRRGFYYPYYFHSRSYYYGYLDWEYNWPHYRDRHHEYDWSDIGRRRMRRYNDDDFDQWRNGKIRRRDRDDWQRVEPPRRPRAEQDERPDRPERPNKRSEERPEDGDRRELKQRPEGKVAKGGERAESRRSERTQEERPAKASVKPPKKEGRKAKAKGERRLQAEAEEEVEALE